MSSWFSDPVPLLTETQQKKFTRVQIIFNAFTSPSESYKKKLNGEYPRDVVIPLSKADEAELVALIKRVEIRSADEVIACVSLAYILSFNLCDENGKVIVEELDLHPVPEKPEYALNRDYYYHLNEKDAARFREIVYSAIDAQDIYAYKLNKREGCSSCGESCSIEVSL